MHTQSGSRSHVRDAYVLLKITVPRFTCKVYVKVDDVATQIRNLY